MANWCQLQRPAGWGEGSTSTGTTGSCPGSTYSANSMWTSSSAYTCGGVKNPYQIYSNGIGATGTPWIFDADVLGISCSAFPSGGSPDTLVGLAGQIAALQSADIGLQAQITAMTPWTAASAAGGVIDTEFQLDAFAAVLGFLVVVWCADRLRRFFWPSYGGGA